MGLADVLCGHRVVVCVGSGGVGKTTTAAALATWAAMQGRRVLCLTIDPAHRLANSLGLDEMKAEEQEVPAALFEAYGLQLRGRLSAMMLDPKRTFDELVTRNASSPEVRDAILENRIYQYVSSSLAGTQEYMAMEKLHSVRDDERFDLVVLDTPPTSNALDFLDAPERLVEMIDSPAMRWFLQASETSTGKFSFSALGKGAALLLKALSRFTGAEFLEEVAGFVRGLNELFGGFRDRATQVSRTLRSADVAFVVVTSPRPMAVREAIFFARRLRDAGMPQDAFVVNGVHPSLEPPTAPTEVLLAELEAAGALEGEAEPGRLLERMWRAFDDEQALARADRLEADRLRAQTDPSSDYIEVPAFDTDVHDLGALAQVAAHLVPGGGCEEEFR